MNKTPTLSQAIAMERIFLNTEFRDGGYVAKCIVDNMPLVTQPKPQPYAAIKHMIDVVIQRKADQGKKRNIDFIFTTKL